MLDGAIAKNAEYDKNKDSMESIISKYTSAVTNALNGGGEKAKLKHKARGKLLARERIDQLLDFGSPFLELSTLAGNGMYGDVPSAGIISGIGKICGVTCVIAANDATVKGGTVIFHLNAYRNVIKKVIVCFKSCKVLPHHSQEALESTGNSDAKSSPLCVSS